MNKYIQSFLSILQVSFDGVPVMMGGLCGFKDYIQRENQNIEVDHCIVHRFALGS